MFKSPSGGTLSPLFLLSFVLHIPVRQAGRQRDGGEDGTSSLVLLAAQMGGVSPSPQLLSSRRAPRFLQRDCDAAVFQLHTPGVAGELLPPLLKLAVRLLIFFFLFLMLFGGCCFLLPNIS